MVQGKNIQTNTDVVLVIDNSGSMRGTKMNSVIEAANTFVDELLNGSTGIQIAVVVINKPNGVNNISGTPFVIENFTDDTASLHTSINNIIANGGTNIQGGFYAARTLLEASSADKKVTILLSDGDPTYSYKSTVNTPSPIPTYNCSTKTWSPSAATVLNNLSIASSIYTTVDGDGANYGLSLYSIQSQNCASNNPKIVTLSVGNNGIPTMYEAGLLMNGPAKSDVYTIGFEVSAGGNAENTLTGSQNKGYFSATTASISSIYSQIRSNISYAATNAVLTDPMSSFIVLEAGTIPTFSVEPVTTGDVVLSKGTATFIQNGYLLNDPDIPTSGNSTLVKWKINWNIGTVSELGDNMYYYVTMAPKTDPTILYDANEQTYMYYTDVNNVPNTRQETPLDFTIPKVSGGTGSIEIVYYTVDDLGQPVNSDGTVVTKENAVKLIPGNSMYYEYNGSTALEVNEAYTVTPDQFYTSNGVTYQLYCGLGNVSITPTPVEPNKNIWFGYLPSTPPNTVNVEYCKDSPAVLLTANLAAGHTSDTYNLYYFDTINGTPQTSIKPSTATVGSKTYYVAEGKSTDCIGPKVPIVVTVYGKPSVALVSKTEIKCFGTSTGSIDISTTGGITPYTYTWTKDGNSYSASTEDIDNLSAGTYVVTVSDSKNCSSTTLSVTINPEPTKLSLTATAAPIACFGSTTTVTLSAKGGSGRYTYDATNPLTTDLTAGTYIYKVKDANGCEASVSVTIEPDPTTITATAITVDNSNCVGCSNGAITQTVSGGTSPYTYLWSNGAITKDLVNLSKGIYSVEIKDKNGCIANYSYSITESGIALVKTGVFSDTHNDGFAQVGEKINYSFTVTNTGNVTVTFIAITDPMLGLSIANSPIASLAEGATTTLTGTYTITQADVDAGKVTNTALATGKDPKGNEVKDTSGTAVDNNTPTETTLNQKGSIALVKVGVFSDTNNDGFAQVGEKINYSFTVTNTGNVTVTSIAITDTMLGLTIPNSPIASLAVGATTTLTGTYTITQADVDAGKVTNTALATGKDPKGNEVKDTSGTAVDNNTPTDTPLPQKGSITVTKDGVYVDSNNDGKTNVGDKITYSFVVTNTGKITLTNVTVTDPLPGIIMSGNPITLNIGASNSTAFVGTYSITQADIDRGLVYNLATVNATTPHSDKVTATSTDPTPSTNVPGKPDCKDCTITILTQNPKLEVVKTTSNTGYSLVGDIINYIIQVKNTGNVTLYQILVTDPLTGLNTTISSLAAGSSQIFNEKYTINEIDLTRNSVTNTAYANGFTPDNTGITASDTLEVDKSLIFGCGTILVHNAFSPNGDGINDVFVIDNIDNTSCYSENTVEIYNRWGVLVFETKNYNNQSNNFDGLSRGRTTINQSNSLPTGTYFYILKYTSVDGNGNIRTNKKDGYLYITK